MSAPAFALLGAGEFETWHDDIDRALLDGSNGDGSVLISPAASAPEGEAVFGTWGAKGLAHYERLGISAADARRAVFLDDVEQNVHAARAVGMHGILVGPDPRPALAELEALVAAGSIAPD